MALFYIYAYEGFNEGDDPVYIYDTHREAADKQFEEEFGRPPTRFLGRDRW